ncbi:MAG: hypothetical protein KC646_13985 [Candidatus Cloacimonetes bacterium]|nr:hypothetical protein [Candidatus Cloacimonadota bacterium]
MKKVIVIGVLLLLSNSIVFSQVKNVCKTIQIIQDLDPVEYSKLRSSKSHKSIQKTVFNLGDLRSMRVDEGSRFLSMRLKYSSLSSTKFGVVRVNVWVDDVLYQSQTTNLLNSANSFSSQAARIADRDVVIQDVGDVLRDDILPEGVKVFGRFQDLPNSNSEGVNVYLYDITDNFSDPGPNGGSYIGGYFDPLDVTGSGNYMKAVHMDIYPNNPGGRVAEGVTKKDFYHVLAHEFQHLLHNQYDQNETIWLNEGLSQFAIYRIFHGKTFPSTASNIIDTPLDAPNQVKWWYGYSKNGFKQGGPQTSHLMTSDESGLQDSSINQSFSKRQDNVELRGIGYLFFCYLWEQLGGGFNLSKQLISSSAAADDVFLNVASSSLNGLSSIQTAINSKGLNFNDLFNSFSMAMYLKASQGALSFNFFQDHVDNTNSSLALNVSQNILSLSPDMVERVYGLDAYAFRFIHLNGTSTNAVINVQGAQNFQATLFGLDSLGGKIIEYQNLSSSHSISIPANQQRILLISNANAKFVDVSIKYIQSLSVSGDVVTPVSLTAGYIDGDLLNPVTINGFQIKKQRLTNNTGNTLDLLNPNPQEIQISACIATQACVHASKLAVKPKRSAMSVSVGGTDYSFSNLSLNNGVSYDLYYANKSASSFSMTPRVTQASVFTVPKNAAPTIVSDVSSSFGSSTGSGGCFLASASFLGKDSYEVQVLSLFRDKYLLTNSLGRAFVKTYYTYSPQVANWMKTNSKIMFIGQVLLIPLVFVSSLLKLGLFQLFLFSLLLMILLPIKLSRRK